MTNMEEKNKNEDLKPAQHIFYSCPVCGKMFSNEVEASYCCKMHEYNKLSLKYAGFKCGDEFPDEVILSDTSGKLEVYSRRTYNEQIIQRAMGYRQWTTH